MNKKTKIKSIKIRTFIYTYNKVMKIKIYVL